MNRQQVVVDNRGGAATIIRAETERLAQVVKKAGLKPR